VQLYLHPLHAFMMVTGKTLHFNLFCQFVLYKICHNPGLSVGIHHFLVYENMKLNFKYLVLGNIYLVWFDLSCICSHIIIHCIRIRLFVLFCVNVLTP